jgi:Dcp1-like decapping family protein
MNHHKKQKHRSHETVQPPPPTTDYARTNEELNLRVLRRHYPHVQTILHIAPYAVLYTFSPAQQWEKSGVEGTLFVVNQSPDVVTSPHDNLLERFSVIILNRRGLDNFSADIPAPEFIESTEEFIILSGEDESAEGFGLWIFSDPPPSSTANLREITAQIMIECAKRAVESRKVVEKARADEEVAHEEALQIDKGVIPKPASVENGDSAPKGRQVSLLELFGQQREMDAGFSVHDHHTNAQPAPREQAPPVQQPPKASGPLFQTNPDTEFFRSGTTPVKAPATKAGTIALEDLFKQGRAG